MPSVNATIGPYSFFALQHQLTAPQREYIRIDELWENGLGFAESGIKTKEEELVAFADFDSPIEKKAALTAYAFLKRTIVMINIREGFLWVPYFNYKILHVENATDVPWSPTASGGMVHGKYLLVSRWIVQNMTGVW